MSDEKRASILAELAKHTGKRVSWKFIKQTFTVIPSIERFHNLITGIYKPAWSDYALSIVIRLNSPYADKDEVVFLEDGRWLMTYSPRTGGMQIADNRALAKCMHERVPIGVFRQLTTRTDRKYGSTYRILGLGLITSYDANTDVFWVESVDHSALEQITKIFTDEAIRYEIELYAQIMNYFQPFVKEETTIYTTTKPKRDKAFREVITREYDYTCAVCEMKFRLGSLIEASAAHIIPKHNSGTDDPRNGLSLCRTHHWAFDEGLFTITDKYQVKLSPIVENAETKNFALLGMETNQIVLPQNEIFHPHFSALDWHKTHIWRKTGAKS